MRQWAHTKFMKSSPLLLMLTSRSSSVNLPLCSCTFGHRQLSVFSHMRRVGFGRTRMGGRGGASVKHGGSASVSACSAINVFTFSQNVSPLCQRPLQHLFILTMSHYAREVEAHKSPICQWSHSERNMGQGDTVRSHKLFTTTWAFSHTQLNPGKARSSPWQQSCFVSCCPASSVACIFHCSVYQVCS